MKTVFVTGVAGFIGSKTCQFLLQKGYKVVGIDNLNNYYDVRIKEKRLERLRNLNGDLTFIKGDIEDKSLLSEIFQKYNFDIVYNIAARAGVRYSLLNPDLYFSTNMNGTLNLLELMKDHGVKKFVLSSTSSLYAGQKMPFIEDLPVNTPISPYAASKKAAEVSAYTYHYLYGIDVSVVRYFTVFGPLGRPDMCIFRFMKWIEAGDVIELFGDGEQSRDFTYVDDIARGTIAAGEKEVGYEIINLGGGNNPISINSTIESMVEFLGKQAKIEFKPFHKADIKTTWASIEKAEALLGWKPKVSVDEGIRLTLTEFMENIEFYRKIELP